MMWKGKLQRAFTRSRDGQAGAVAPPSTLCLHPGPAPLLTVVLGQRHSGPNPAALKPCCRATERADYPQKWTPKHNCIFKLFHWNKGFISGRNGDNWLKGQTSEPEVPKCLTFFATPKVWLSLHGSCQCHPNVPSVKHPVPAQGTSSPTAG